ncbi:MAG: hypothetical protein L6V92_07575 [Phocaeicola vulgatus]|nr:MAG: hypothetical protein L6V92_07575 [Phocaeicola vulgatus]
MSTIRKILNVYRKIQYTFCGRFHLGVMPIGEVCSHEPFEQEINFGDVVHPCVRYIPEGFLGYKWWMVYTPYYKSNDKTENPILCYAKGNEITPPTHWCIHSLVQGQPQKGYNSDPVLLYVHNKLYVFWRENFTARCKANDFAHATFGALVEKNGISKVFGPIVGTSDAEVDPETSPAFIKEENGTFRCLATHITFHSKIIKSLPKSLQRIVNQLLLVLDLLGVWSQQKAHGVAQWSCEKVDGIYHYDKTIRFENKNPLYRPWHIDFFEWDKILYAVVQSNQCNADICLAESKDRVHFRLFRKPLMTNETCGKVGIYKPTAGVVNGNFFLYYTAQDVENRALNKLYLTTMNFNELLNLIE